MTNPRLDSKKVICPFCGARVRRSDDHCGATPVLDGRYVLDRVVGSGAIGTTYAGVRTTDGARLAIKQLLLRQLDSTKALSLFEREATTLRKLDHAGIPRYVDHFQWGNGNHTGLYLVQEFIDGETLAEELESRVYTDEDVFEIAVELAEIVEYVHSASPPVIHRDLKPDNIMRRRSDGRLMLIDFGSVRHVVEHVSDGSTISGTIGYMAPEQLHGRACPATDMFGLGMTLLALRTGSDPGALVARHGADWMEKVRLSEAMRRVVEAMTSPDRAERPDGLSELRELIAGQRHRALARGKRFLRRRRALARIREVPALPALRDGLREYGWLVQLLAILLILGVGGVAALHTLGMAPGAAAAVLFVFVVVLLSTRSNPSE